MNISIWINKISVVYQYTNIYQYIYTLYIELPVFGLRLVGGGGARQDAKTSKIGAQI